MAAGSQQTPAQAAPTTPKAAETVPKADISTNRNISSKTVDNQEIDSIANKLKESLNTKTDTTSSSQQGTSTQKDSIVAKTGTKGMFSHDDTIHIDKNGNLTSKTSS